MYIYFDRNGTIKEVINDESIRRGSSDYNKIYCYLEGNPDIDDIWYLQKNPDGTLTNEVSFVDNIVTKAIPYDAKRDMKYFQDFKEYQFYVFTLSSSYLSQNGLVVATIRVAENNTLWALGELTFNVQANIVNSDNDITQSQYDYLLLAYASRTLNEQTGSDLNNLLDDKIEAKANDIIEPIFNDYKETIDEEVENQNETIASLIQASPRVFDTASNITALTENNGVAVATDTGYIYYWDSTLPTPAYVSSGLQYNNLTDYVKHDGNQLKDSNGNNIYPNISDDIKFLWGNLSEQAFNPANTVDIKASVQSSTIAPSDLTSTIFVPLVENDTIVIDRLIDNPYVLVIGFSNGNEVGANVVQQLVICSGGVEYISAKRIIRTVPQGYKYLAVAYYSAYDTNYSKSELLASFRIYSQNYGYYVEKINDINERINKIDLLQSATYISYFTTVKNPTTIDFNNQPIQLKATFKQGECRGYDFIKVFNNDVEIESQAEGCKDANTVRGNDYSYYPDGTLKAVTIWIIDSIEANSTKNYEVRIYQLKQDAQNVNITYTYSSDIYTVNVANHKYKFHNRRALWGPQAYDDAYYIGNQTNITYSGVVHQFANSEVTLNSLTINGSGTIFIDIIYDMTYNNVNVISTYRVFNNGTIRISNRLCATDDIAANTVTSFRAGYDFRNLTAMSNVDTYLTRLTWAGGSLDVVAELTDGNVKRVIAPESENLPMYGAIYFNVVSATNQKTIQLGWSGNAYLKPNFAFHTIMWLIPTANDNNSLMVFNKLVGYLTNINKEENYIKIENKVKEETDRIMTTLVNYSAMDSRRVNILFTLYKEYKMCPLSDVISYFKIVYANATSAQQIYDDFFDGTSTLFNGEWIGKNISTVLYLYQECIKLNDTENSTYFYNFITYVAEFYCMQYANKGDLYLHKDVVTNNGRATGCFCISIGYYLTQNNNYLSVYNSMLTKIYNDGTVFENILPDGNTSNMVTQRYIHYEAYTIAYLMMGANLMNTQISKDYVSRLLDYVTAHGEIRDEEFEASTERKGLGLTYCYLIIPLLLERTYDKVACATQIFDAYLENNTLNDLSIYPRDGYAPELAGTNTSQISREEVAELNNILFFIRRIRW